jgi:hypothetical protein
VPGAHRPTTPDFLVQPTFAQPVSKLRQGLLRVIALNQKSPSRLELRLGRGFDEPHQLVAAVTVTPFLARILLPRTLCGHVAAALCAPRTRITHRHRHAWTFTS